MSISQPVEIATALFERFPTVPADSKHSIVLFVTSVIARDRKQFVKSNFVHLILQTASCVNPRLNHPISLYLFKCLDSLAAASTPLFLDQLLIVADNDFSAVYLSRFLQLPAFSEAVGKFLSEQFIHLTQFKGKVAQDIKFVKLLLITQILHHRYGHR